MACAIALALRLRRGCSGSDSELLLASVADGACLLLFSELLALGSVGYTHMPLETLCCDCMASTLLGLMRSWAEVSFECFGFCFILLVLLLLAST